MPSLVITVTISQQQQNSSFLSHWLLSTLYFNARYPECCALGHLIYCVFLILKSFPSSSPNMSCLLFSWPSLCCVWVLLFDLSNSDSVLNLNHLHSHMKIIFVSRCGKEFVCVLVSGNNTQ